MDQLPIKVRMIEVASFENLGFRPWKTNRTYTKPKDRYEKDSVIVSVRGLMVGTINDEG